MDLKNRNICIKLLEEAFESSSFINDIVSNYFYKNNLDTKSKKNISNMLFGTTRMKGKYDYILSNIYNGKYSSIKPKLKNILRLACYQIDKMDSVPDHAAVSTFVEITKKKMFGYQNLVNALLRKFIIIKNDYAFDIENKKTFGALSHPDWLLDKWIGNLGLKKAVKICKYNNQSPVIWFRINDFKKTKFILEIIKKMNLKFDFHKLDDSYFKVTSPFNLIDSSLFKDGAITIQNPLNGSIVKLLDPKNNEVIIDGCSAPGGKGILLSLLAPNAEIFSIDNNKKRMDKVVESIKRHKITNLKPLVLDMISDTLPMANKILIDVPCSGTGVINRRVDLRWKRSLNDIEKSSSIQYNILDNASRFLLNRGVIVYSTCSIEKEENINVVKKFLDDNKNFIVEDASDFVNDKIVENKIINVLPGDYDLDGGFAVRLRKI